MGAITFKTEKDGSFSAAVSRCMREPNSWKKEVYATARFVAGRAKKPLLLFFSGGLDSEIMCRSFFDQGITFTATTFEHEGGANRRDVEHAKKWCWDRNVTHHVVPFETPGFFGQPPATFAESGFISSNIMRYFQAALLAYAEDAGFFSVIGDGGQLYRSDPGTQKIQLRFGPGDYGLAQWSEEHDTDHEPFFFRATPELYAAYLHIPIVVFGTANPPLFYPEYNKHVFKRLVYQSEWPDTASRPYATPFGHFRPDRLKKEAELKVFFGNKLSYIDIPIDNLARSYSPTLTMPITL